VPIAQSTWELICENQDSGSGFEVTEAILEHFKLLSLSAKQVTPVAHAALPQWARLDRQVSAVVALWFPICGSQGMSSKWTDRAILKHALQLMENLSMPDPRTLFAAIIAVSEDGASSSPWHDVTEESDGNSFASPVSRSSIVLLETPRTACGSTCSMRTSIYELVGGRPTAPAGSRRQQSRRSRRCRSPSSPTASFSKQLATHAAPADVQAIHR
jgi:hypothetical protein